VEGREFGLQTQSKSSKMLHLYMSNESAQRIYRVVHAELPEQWKQIIPRPRIVQEVNDTSYLQEDAFPGTEVVIGGVNLGICVLDHLIELANRKPVKDGRVTLLLSLSATLAWHLGEDAYGLCSLEEFEKVVDDVMRRTKVKVVLVD